MSLLHWRSLWLGLALLLLLLGAADLLQRGLALRPSDPAAEWIWASGRGRNTRSRAFFLARDFRLESVPVRAELLALGDEEYLLWLNGHRVGANRYRPEAPLDVYEVTRWLVPGTNRIVAELRSRRGAGGFLAWLQVRGRKRPVISTDGSWRYFAVGRPTLLDGRLALEHGREVHSWGRPPVGRWGEVRPGPLRHTLERLIAGDEHVVPAEIHMATGSGSPGLLLDWGREVVGYLHLEVAPERNGACLLYFGKQPPRAAGRRRPDALILGLPRPLAWQGSLPRRFRYLLVVGERQIRAASVEPVDPQMAADLLMPSAPALGLLGLDPPLLRPPVQHEIRREF